MNPISPHASAVGEQRVAASGKEERPAGDRGILRPATLVTIFVLGALALRLPRMAQSVWFDETYMSSQLVGSMALLLKTIYADIHPPLYTVFMFAWNKLFGDSEVSMRLPPLLFGLASIPLSYLVGRRFAGSAAGLWAAFLLSFSPVHLWYSSEARQYSLMLFLTLATVHAWQRIVAGATRRTWPYGVLILLMATLHYYLALYILLFTSLDLLGRRRVLAWNVIALSVLALWVLAKSYFADIKTGQPYLEAFGPRQAYELLFQWFWTGNCVAVGATQWHPRWLIWVALQIGGIAIVARGLWVMRLTPAKALLVLACILVIPAFLFAVSLLGLGQTYIERSVLPALPFFLILAAAGLASLGRRLCWVAGAAVVAASAINLAALFVFDEEWTVYKPRPDWRAAANYLGDEIDAGGAGRPLFTPYPNPRSLAYYDSRIQHVRNLEPSPPFARGSGALAEFLAAMTASFEQNKKELLEGMRMPIYSTEAGNLSKLQLEQRAAGGVFYLLANRWHPPGDRSVEAILEHPQVLKIETRSFRSLTIHKLRRAR